jgi:glycosyltransferase involved in cell wall biosynthesis
MTDITFFFRNRAPGAFSIDQIFDLIAAAVAQDRPVEKCVLPKPSNSIFNLFHNLASARRRSTAGVNHITGDVHYIALVLQRGKTVLTIHDCVLLDRTSPNRPKYWLYLWLWYKLPIRTADVVTTISEKSKKEIIRYTGCPADKIQVIPNPVDPLYRYDPKSFNNVCPRILQVGVAPHKNLPRVIAALEGIPCILEIIGRLKTRQIEMLEQSGLQYENRFDLSLEELAERYRASDAVVFASLYEGFGMPVVEAQATGRPVIASNIEPMPWVAGEGGACFVDPTDVTSIREGILKVVQDQEYRNALISKGLENIGRFSLERITGTYTKIYNKMLSDPDSPNLFHCALCAALLA